MAFFISRQSPIFFKAHDFFQPKHGGIMVSIVKTLITTFQSPSRFSIHSHASRRQGSPNEQAETSDEIFQSNPNPTKEEKDYKYFLPHLVLICRPTVSQANALPSELFMYSKVFQFTPHCFPKLGNIFQIVNFFISGCFIQMCGGGGVR